MANIKADEITKILREQIENYQQTLAVEEVGTVISVGDGIARIHGLDKCMAGEMIEFPHDVFGIALNLEEDQVGAGKAASGAGFGASKMSIPARSGTVRTPSFVARGICASISLHAIDWKPGCVCTMYTPGAARNGV